MSADFCGAGGEVRTHVNEYWPVLAAARIRSVAAWIVGIREGGQSFVRRKFFDGSEVGECCGRTYAYVGVNHGILRYPVVPLSVVDSIRVNGGSSQVATECSQASCTGNAKEIEQAREALPVRASKPNTVGFSRTLR